MEDLEELIKSILEQGYLMSLATVDEGGPWVSDVVFVSDNMDLYWRSQVITRHSQAILTNPSVAATITVSNMPGEDNIGLQIEGQAEKLEGEELVIATKHVIKRKKNPPAEGEKSIKEGEPWYKLTPTSIDIIYEPKWGWSKKNIKL
jgi:uncharacterized protein YhbP (UPF0306 family)